MDKLIIAGAIILIGGLILILSQGPSAVSLVSDKDIIGGEDALPIIFLFFIVLGAFAFAMGAVLSPKKKRAKQ